MIVQAILFTALPPRFAATRETLWCIHTRMRGYQPGFDVLSLRMSGERFSASVAWRSVHTWDRRIGDTAGSRATLSRKL